MPNTKGQLLATVSGQAERLDQGSVGRDPVSWTQVFSEICGLDSASPVQPNLKALGKERLAEPRASSQSIMVSQNIDLEILGALK